jgi:hypothetical protein
MYTTLLTQLSFLNPVHWPADYDDIAKYGEDEIEALSQLLHVHVDSEGAV